MGCYFEPTDGFTTESVTFAGAMQNPQLPFQLKSTTTAYSFPILQRIGVLVGLNDWLHSSSLPQTVTTHLSTNWAQCTVMLSMQLVLLPLDQTE